MIKLLSIIQRKPGMDVEAFQEHWRAKHAPIVMRLPGLRRYIQSHTLLSGYRSRTPVADGIAELWFDDTAALRELNGSEALAAVRADEARFIDVHTHQQLFVDEHVVKDAPAAPDSVKNIELVRRKTGMSVADFQRHWRDIHGPLGAAITSVTRYVQNHARASSYYDGRTPPLDGLAVTWFRDTNAMRSSATTPEYAATRVDEPNFIMGPAQFIITREHVMLA
jgi:uncharacterized protein (TIGR02118 family)